MNISVELLGDLFKVTVTDRVVSIHEVKLSDEYAEFLTLGRKTKKELIEFSFRFLLEREPNTSILRSFHLKEITNYFPEFEGSVKKWATSG